MEGRCRHDGHAGGDDRDGHDAHDDRDGHDGHDGHGGYDGHAGCDDRDCVVCDCGGRDLNGEISWAAA